MDNEKEIPFGAFDSELMHQEITIPEGFEATIEGNKIILKKTESDDVKIRKELIKVFSNREKYLIDQSFGDITVPEILAWLEKQGNVARLWTIQDAKKGDILADKYGVYIYDQLDIFDESACVFICGYQYSDKKFEPESMICNKSDFYPATKEQRDLLFQKMKEAGYEWDSEKKELKKIELSDVGHEYYSELLKNDKSDNIADYAYQCVYCMSHDWAIENPTWDNVQSACRLGAKWQKKHDVSEDWSEEDEKMIGRVRGIIEAYAFSQSAVDVNGDLCEKKFIDVDIWLKAIKDRYSWKPSSELDETSYQVGIKRVLENPESYGLTKYNWKPSDEQMNAFEQVYDWYNNNFAPSETLTSLYKDLEKLKGE